MAWTCAACQREVAIDTEGCPGCGALKDSWTVQAQKTRTFSIGAPKKFELWRHDGPRAPLAPPATIRAVSKASLAGGQPPAEADLLIVRTFAKGDKDPTAVITVPYAARPAAELEFPDPTSQEASFDRRYLFVAGPGEPPALEGVRVVDVTDGDDPKGHVPHVLVTGLKKKKAVKLPVTLAAAPKTPRFVFSR